MNVLLAAAVGLLLMASPILAQEKGQAAQAAQEKQHRAEQLADRFGQRFRETLDFGVVYHEFFVTDPQKRSLHAKELWTSERQEEMLRALSPSELEQAYIGFMNLYYLGALYYSNVFSSEEEEDGEIKEKDVVPPELLEAIKDPSVSFFFCDWVKDASCNDDREPFQKADDVRKFINGAERVAALFRKYIPPEPFDSPGYKAHVKQLEWDGRETSVSEGNDYFGVGEEIKVYQVYRELIVLDILEENGEMKVCGIPIGN